jgi:hypothetical protein
MRPWRYVRTSRKYSTLGVASVVVLAGLAATWRAGAATHRLTEAHGASPAPDHFEISSDAREQLGALWQESAEAKEERVACLAASVDRGAWQLTSIEPLPSVYGDSLRVSALPSVARCGPPRWVGTVHTHVALRDGVSPYARFSGSDRGVMMMWWRRWGRLGIFCLLYSEHDAHCEADGQLLAGGGTHVSY